MKRVIALLVTVVLAALVSGASAHELKTAGPYDVLLGFVNEPPVTDTLNGLDLIVRSSADEKPVDNLEKSLDVTIVAPDDSSSRSLPLSAVDGSPGHYTSPFILSQPGVYALRVHGYIGSTQVDVTFRSDEVAPASSITFP
ncbi:MAG: hypothetical protein P8Y02_07155 [Deinococcales bacterium]